MAYLTGQVLTEADIAALFTSGTYTPTLGNMAIGTGGTPTNTAKFTFVGFPAGGVLTVEGKIKFGTTSVTLPAASNETVSLPAGYALIDTSTAANLISSANFVDVSSTPNVQGCLTPVTSTTLLLSYLSVASPLIGNGPLGATAPFTWAINDEIYWRFSARCTGP